MEAIQASHLGVFPSYYEPWGYTPLETAAQSVGAVTTDLAGFGRYIKKESQTEKKTPGIFVLERQNKTQEEITNSLSDFFFQFVKFSDKEREQNKLRAKSLASIADWKILIKEYFKAHEMAKWK